MNMTMRLAAGFLIATCAHAQDAPNYAYAWPIVTEADSAAYQIELTPEVVAESIAADLSDLDVINAAGESVPTAPYRVAATRQVRTVLPPTYAIVAPKKAATTDEGVHLHIERGADGTLRSLDADITPVPPRRSGTGTAQNEQTTGVVTSSDAPTIALDSATQLIVDTSALHEPLSGLRIDWRLDGYAHLAISASDDLQTWRALAADAVVMRFTQQGNTLQRHEVPLHGNAYGYLLIRRIDTEAPLDDVHVAVMTLGTEQQAEQRWIGAESEGAEATNGTDGAAFRYRLPAPLALNAAGVQLADDNSVANATLYYQRMSDTSYIPAMSGFVVFRLRDGNNVLTNDPLRYFTTQRTRELKLVFSNPIAHAPALRVAYTPDRLVFLAQGAGPFRMVAGSATAHRTNAPVNAALASLRASAGANWEPPPATLGARAQMRGPQALQAPTPARPPPWRTWLLWSVLVAAAAIVAGLALSLLRKH